MVSTLSLVSARFRTLSRNAAAESRARTLLSQITDQRLDKYGDPAIQQLPIKQAGKNPIKGLLMSMIERLLVIRERGPPLMLD